MTFQKTRFPGKIYVGHIKYKTSEEELRSFFSSFGQVIGIEQPFQYKNQKKNYAFILFEKEINANWLINAGSVYLKGHKLVIKQAYHQEVQKINIDEAQSDLIKEENQRLKQKKKAK